MKTCHQGRDCHARRRRSRRHGRVSAHVGSCSGVTASCHSLMESASTNFLDLFARMAQCLALLLTILGATIRGQGASPAVDDAERAVQRCIDKPISNARIACTGDAASATRRLRHELLASIHPFGIDISPIPSGPGDPGSWTLGLGLRGVRRGSRSLELEPLEFQCGDGAFDRAFCAAGRESAP